VHPPMSLPLAPAWGSHCLMSGACNVMYCNACLFVATHHVIRCLRAFAATRPALHLRLVLWLHNVRYFHGYLSQHIA
jgi:hypothetical protein